ncbi:hypothetical protein [Nonomuraea sp. NPDC049646]|uniref:hypothetical protein n=1 Tax=unclassified Nonomuraea TaxID=2593643 RepID=UPI003792E3AE
MLGLGTLYATSVPGWHFPWLMAAGAGWVLFGVAWLVMLGGVLIRRERVVTLRRHWPFWGVPLLVVALTGALVYIDAPMRVRFELSRGGLEHIAQTVSEGTPPGKRRWIGLYPVKYLEGSRGAFGFMIKDAGFFGSYGFAWSADGEPDVDGSGSYRHFDGRWYVWSDD